MEPSKEPISVRIARMNNLFLGRPGTFLNCINSKHHLGREGLLDALVVLYDECNNDTLKKDRNIGSFVDKFRGIVSELRRLRVNIADFEVKKVIGRGHFGEVQVVREKQTGDVYAMKTLRKADTLNQQAAAFYQEERDIMAHANSPWLTMLQYSFQDMHHLYLVMEFHPGGDLLALLERFEGVLSEDMARFYLAELALAVRSLHSMGYVHRDIKPDNVLVDRCGHLKLADFGSAARLSPAGVVTSQLPVGTPEYIAPEVLQAVDQPRGKNKHQSYGVECDYWSLGVVAYEMIVGRTPFSGEQLVATYNNIMNHHKSLKFPEDCEASAAFRHLVGALLEAAPVRLTHEGILKHEFFASIDWNGLRNMVPPFVPVVNGVDDTSNFVEFEHEVPALSIENFKTRKEFSGKDLPFIGFTYTHDVNPSHLSESSSSPRKSSDVESQLAAKKKEIEDLHIKLKMAEQSHRNQSVEALERKLEERTRRLEMVEVDRGQLELALEKYRNEVQSLKRTLDLEREDRKMLETNALAMIRDSKAKWERRRQQETMELRKQIEARNKQIEELGSLKQDMVSKVQKLTDELEAARSETRRMQELLEQSQDKIAKAREQSRMSVVGAESRLEKIASENQQQLISLQQALDMEVKLRTDVQTKLRELEASAIQKETELSVQCNNLRSEKSELQTALDLNVQKCLALEAKMEQETRRYNVELKARSSQLDQVLRQQKKEQCELKELRVRLVAMEGQLNDSVRSQDQSLRLQESEAQVSALESELKQSSEERMKLQKKLHDATEKSSELARKVSNLEDLFTVLRETSSRLESENCRLKEQISALGEVQQTVVCNHADNTELVQQKVFLETQVEKLEAQLEKLREETVLERDAAKNVQAQLFKKEKELSDAKIDLRIAQREARAAEEELKGLQEEKKSWQEKLQAEKSLHTEELKANWDKVEALREEQNGLRAELERRQGEYATLVLQLEAEKALLADTNHELEACKVQLQASRRECDAVRQHKGTLEKQVSSLQSETACLRKQCDKIREEKNKISAELDEQKSRNNSLEMNLNVLKETCTMLEEQLEDYETLTATYAEKEKTAAVDKETLESKVESLQGEVRSARQATNEEKSLRIRAETKLQQLQAELETHKEDITALQKQVQDYKTLAENLTKQVTELEDKCGSAELNLRGLRRQLETKEGELTSLKEESTQQLTQIHSLRESNFKLSRELDEAQDRCQLLEEKLSEVQAAMEELQVFHKHREIKTDATLQQQAKLIDFLQSTLAEHTKKKKTFTDKLFGSRQKENIAPGPTGTRELEVLLARERNKVKLLTDQLNRAQLMSVKEEKSDNSLVTAPVTPNSRNVISQIVQSPESQRSGTFERQPSLQRMHHNIPHRFEPKLCMRATKCAVCLDSIHFGRQAAVCQECQVTAHPKCSLVLPTTCGLPTGFARHFSQTWNNNSQDSNVSDGKEQNTSPALSMEGYVKLPRRNRSGWERNYLRLQGSVLEVFDTQPTSKDAVPVSTFEVCPPEGTTSVLSAVPYSDVVNTAKSDLPYILKVEVSPRTTCWPGSSMLIMALSFPDKQKWVQALEAVVQGQHKIMGNPSQRYKGQLVLRLSKEKAVDLNCCLQLTDQLLVLGAEEGLYSLRMLKKAEDATPVHIFGVTHVYQLAVIHSLSIVIMIAGESRNLLQCDLRQLRSSAEAAECSQASITTRSAILVSPGVPANSFHLFGVSPGSSEPNHQSRPMLCTVTSEKLVLLRWSSSQEGFSPLKVLDTAEPCSCIHFSSHSLLVGSNKFFEIDLRDLTVEEFLDSSDKTLAHAVFGTQQLNSYPIAILDVTRSGEPEYLLCFNEFGVFVDQYGQRTREDDVKWSHLPFAFAYRKPYLFIIHFTSVEVMKLTPASFTRTKDDSNSTLNFPEQKFIELSSPRYLGAANGVGAIFVSCFPPDSVEMLRLDGKLVSNDGDLTGSVSSLDTVSERDGADLNDCGGSEFSFTSSLVQSLEDSECSPLSETTESSVETAPNRRVHFQVPRSAK
ncbi:citron rho-interacting kinase [Anabrus simplex]|uniref:citron rho-interacting kinase n=1 Tax=Anabrus simplex TaxID=316456 RepID=UPI0035A2824A